MLYDQTCDSIIKNGQTAAIQFKNYLSEYLSTSIDAIKLSAYTIDRMIRSNRTNEEILDYLIGQSTAVTNTVFENRPDSIHTSTANTSTARGDRMKIIILGSRNMVVAHSEKSEISKNYNDAEPVSFWAVILENAEN